MLKEKLKRIVIQIIFCLIIFFTMIVNMSLKCYAKYAFNYNMTAAEVKIEG